MIYFPPIQFYYKNAKQNKYNLFSPIIINYFKIPTKYFFSFLLSFQDFNSIFSILLIHFHFKSTNNHNLVSNKFRKNK